MLRSLPFSVDYWIIYWNKELFEAKGLAYPTTFEELAKAAEALTDPYDQHLRLRRPRPEERQYAGLDVAAARL